MHPFFELTNRTPSPSQKEDYNYRKHSPWTAARHKKKTRSVQQQSGDPVYQQTIPEAFDSPGACHSTFVRCQRLLTGRSTFKLQPKPSLPACINRMQCHVCCNLQRHKSRLLAAVQSTVWPSACPQLLRELRRPTHRRQSARAQQMMPRCTHQRLTFQTPRCHLDLATAAHHLFVPTSQTSCAECTKHALQRAVTWLLAQHRGGLLAAPCTPLHPPAATAHSMPTHLCAPGTSWHVLPWQRPALSMRCCLLLCWLSPAGGLQPARHGTGQCWRRRSGSRCCSQQLQVTCLVPQQHRGRRRAGSR